MTKFLLVHGAFQGGWVWRELAGLLRAQGHEVHRPTLSGCGYLSGRQPRPEGLQAYIGDIKKYMELEDLKDIVLVAHSFSGMICGALIMQLSQRIRQAVFIDAAIPVPGQSFAEVAGENFQNMLEKHRMADGNVRPWPAQVFGVAGPEAQGFESRLRPFPHEAFVTPFPGAFDPAAVKTAYIGCRDTASPFIRETALKAASHGWRIFQLDSGHCPMISCPGELSRMLITASSGGPLP
jgi:pimeloyl-ACP methyl ester carboxylesterase